MKKIMTVIMAMLIALAGLQTTFAEAAIYEPMYTVGELDCKRDDMNIYGMLYMPVGDEEEYPAVIVSHGYLGSINFMESYAIAFAEAGYICYTFDYCGGGIFTRSDGEMSEMTLSSEIADLNAVIDTITALDLVDEDNLFLFGESQGGFVSAVTAAQRVEDVKALMLLYPGFSIPENCRLGVEGAAELTGLTFAEDYIEDGASFDAYEAIAPYDRNVLIVHGDADNLVPIAYSEEALDVYESAELVVVPDGNHGFSDFQKPAVKAKLIEFMEENIG